MKLQKLRSLFLNGNGLTELPSDFGSLKALKDGKFYRFSVSAPCEVALEMLFWGWKGLKVVTFSFVLFSKIIERNVRHESWHFQAKVQQKAPWSLQNMFFLTFWWVLELTSCAKSHVVISSPVNFVDPKELHLENNKLRSLPESFGDLTELRKLSLERNPHLVWWTNKIEGVGGMSFFWR